MVNNNRARYLALLLLSIGLRTMFTEKTALVSRVVEDMELLGAKFIQSKHKTRVVWKGEIIGDFTEDTMTVKGAFINKNCQYFGTECDYGSLREYFNRLRSMDDSTLNVYIYLD